ncbi:FAD-binding oxidoreductase [Falsochrobactrum sp. TDYN1]|uniref:FAD-binding oxidoreductase n=1 Tax=Falsochrobactrum tianjinense TaxID=2706015 RepID=A0A949UW55_9HYPH|nr:FAD-binding oxidoreductase [Falsochrobactrum sp. TDYN1]MBV2144946.1 FAD-binding oxidoreductase [Falsochrobactrum sp. TDYN1]
MTTRPPFDDIKSLWQATAVSRPQFSALEGDGQYDVAIIGGGYTGLSTARYLARKGLSAVVLEASRIGWGASGRNGGVVSAKFRLAYRDIASRFGIDVARRMHDISIEAAEHVGELVSDYTIEDTDYHATGSLRCAHNQISLDALKAECAWLNKALGDSACSIQSAEEVTHETGSNDFVGGMLNTHGGIIHPLNFVLGLARGVQADGVTICENTPAFGIKREANGVIVETDSATIHAKTVVIATNSYPDLTKATAPVKKSIIPFRSAMIATQPLTGTAGEHLLVNGRSYTETRRMMRWFRKSGDRLIYGGRGAFGRTDSEAAFAALHKAMVKQFPELGSVQVTHRWSGLVAMTLDSLPHVGRLDDKIVYALGYNGTGVAMSSYIGKHVAEIAAGKHVDLGLLTQLPLKQIPFYGLRAPAVRVVAGWYQFLDAIGR